jgi:hypothetical protein
MSWLSSWWKSFLNKGFFISFRLGWPGEKNEPDNLDIYPNDDEVKKEDEEQIRKEKTQ